jgi:hypothetical protein
MRNAGDFSHFDLKVTDSMGETHTFKDVRSYSVDGKEVLHLHNEEGPIANFSSRGWISAVVILGAK